MRIYYLYFELFFIPTIFEISRLKRSLQNRKARHYNRISTPLKCLAYLQILPRKHSRSYLDIIGFLQILRGGEIFCRSLNVLSYTKSHLTLSKLTQMETPSSIYHSIALLRLFIPLKQKEKATSLVPYLLEGLHEASFKKCTSWMS